MPPPHQRQRQPPHPASTPPIAPLSHQFLPSCLHSTAPRNCFESCAARLQNCWALLVLMLVLVIFPCAGSLRGPCLVAMRTIPGCPLRVLQFFHYNANQFFQCRRTPRFVVVSAVARRPLATRQSLGMTVCRRRSCVARLRAAPEDFSRCDRFHVTCSCLRATLRDRNTRVKCVTNSRMFWLTTI